MPFVYNHHLTGFFDLSWGGRGKAWPQHTGQCGWIFYLSLKGDAVCLLEAGTRRDRCIHRTRWQLLSSFWPTSFEAFYCFMESVTSPVSPQTSILTPRHRYMLNDVLIICRFWLSALESSGQRHMQTHFFLKAHPVSIGSAELPTIPCYRLCASCFQNPRVSLLPVLIFSCWLVPGGPSLLPSVMKMLPVWRVLSGTLC